MNLWWKIHFLPTLNGTVPWARFWQANLISRSSTVYFKGWNNYCTSIILINIYLPFVYLGILHIANFGAELKVLRVIKN